MKRIRQERIILATLFTTCVGGLQVLYDHATLHSSFSSGTSDRYDFETALWLNVASGFIGGLLASITLTYVDDRFRTKPYYQGLLIILSVFLSIWVTRNFVEGMMMMNAGGSFKFLVDGTDFKNLVFWMLIIVLIYFFFQMGNKFGPDRLFKIFLGRYNLPRKEERLFMFLDLKSSTSIAEQLGGMQYHLFLKEVFADVTKPILEHGGEIYQYVGDEIVLTWEVDKVGPEWNFISCFHAMKRLLDQEEDKYQRKFGVKPLFKAGAHYGTVIAGEVGVMKRDITYSGDVLNTAARIQGLCNELGSDLLVSKDILSLHAKSNFNLNYESKGEISLKGKMKATELIGISLN